MSATDTSENAESPGGKAPEPRPRRAPHDLLHEADALAFRAPPPPEPKPELEPVPVETEPAPPLEEVPATTDPEPAPE